MILIGRPIRCDHVGGFCTPPDVYTVGPLVRRFYWPANQSPGFRGLEPIKEVPKGFQSRSESWYLTRSDSWYLTRSESWYLTRSDSWFLTRLIAPSHNRCRRLCFVVSLLKVLKLNQNSTYIASQSTKFRLHFNFDIDTPLWLYMIFITV